MSLERVLYYEDYLVVDPGDTPLKDKQLLSELEYREAIENYGDTFDAKMGAEAVHDLLAIVLRYITMDKTRFDFVIPKYITQLLTLDTLVTKNKHLTRRLFFE